MSKADFRASFRTLTGQIVLPSLSEATEQTVKASELTDAQNDAAEAMQDLFNKSNPKKRHALHSGWRSSAQLMTPFTRSDDPDDKRDPYDLYVGIGADWHPNPGKYLLNVHIETFGPSDGPAVAASEQAAEAAKKVLKAAFPKADAPKVTHSGRGVSNANSYIAAEDMPAALKQLPAFAKQLGTAVMKVISAAANESISEGVKDDAYNDGRMAGSAVVDVIRKGWAKQPKNDSLAAWMKIVDEYVGEELKEFIKDPQWLKGFQSALVGAFGKAMPLRRESKENADKEVIIKTLLAAFKKGGKDEMMMAAYKLEGQGISKPMLSSLLRWMTRTGELGNETVSLTDREKWLINQYAYDIRESKGFHHGTVRAWKNGRHMKQGSGWERVRSGRSLPLASKMPAVSDAAPGGIPAGPYGAGVFEDPSDFSRQAVPTRNMSAAIVNAVAGRDVFAVGEALELYAKHLDGETLDEGALAKMKMVFGKLLKVGEKPKAPVRAKGLSPMKRERQGIQDYLARKKASIERGER